MIFKAAVVKFNVQRLASVSEICSRFILSRLFITLLGLVGAFQSTQAAPMMCHEAQNQIHDPFNQLELMEVTDRHLQELNERYVKMRDEGRRPRQSTGILTSNRAGRYWGDIELSEHRSLRLGGTPRLMRGRFWLPVLLERKEPETDSDVSGRPLQPEVYRYVSLDSIYSVYGKSFFENQIKHNTEYLAPVGPLQRHVYELVKIIKEEGDQLLIRNRHGETRRISKQDFFTANVAILHWPGFALSLPIGRIRDFFELGGQGEIFLSEQTTSPQKGAEIAFEGYYIRIKKMPRFQANLFADREAYQVFVENVGLVPIYYTLSSYFAGVNSPKDSPGSVNMKNRLKLKERTGFIGVTSGTEASTFLHEKRHYDDTNANPILQQFLAEIAGLSNVNRLPKDAKLIFHHALFEQRAYAVEVEFLKKRLGKSEDLDEQMRERIDKVKSDFLVLYLEPLLRTIEKVAQEDQPLAEWIKSEVQENAYPSDEVTFPF